MLSSQLVIHLTALSSVWTEVERPTSDLLTNTQEYGRRFRNTVTLMGKVELCMQPDLLLPGSNVHKSSYVLPTCRCQIFVMVLVADEKKYRD